MLLLRLALYGLSMLMSCYYLQFLDMSSLEAALPSAQLAHDYLAGGPKSRYSQNPAATYVSSLPEGKF